MALKGNRITIPEFELVSNPTIKITDIKRRVFNVIDRSNDYEIRMAVREYNKCKDSDPERAARIFAELFGNGEEE